MPQHDLDRIEREAAAALIKNFSLTGVSPSDVLAMVAAVSWALDAAHHPGCSGDDGGACKCGRDVALAPFEATT